MRTKTLTVISAVMLSACLLGCKKKEMSADALTVEEKTEVATKASVEGVGAAGISGVNWGDARDNFQTGWVIPSGLGSGDSYATVSAKANAILSEFQSKISGVNTVRLPVNPPSVSEAWWGSYTGAIDKALSKGMKVILAYWEGNGAASDGKIDDTTKFWAMWQTIVNKYGSNANVYLEPMNEPRGYSLAQLTTIYAEFLSRYPSVSRGRIILGGTGYSQDIQGVGADSRFSSCLLALHDYTFFNSGTKTQAGWESSWKSKYSGYANRTVVTEFGVPMTTGKNYTGAVGNDNEIAYLVGATNVFRADKVASVYWPGLRDNDSWSMTTRGGSGNNITLSVTNASGLSRLRYGWGL